MATIPENWQLLATAEDVAETALQVILSAAEKAIAEKGSFHFVTAGGTTPNAIYAKLAALSDDALNWDAWHIYMGDERVLPANNSERNSKVLNDIWLKDSKIPAQNQHLMRTELGLEASAEDYRQQISGVSFDVVMLGMGEDGHTASLFPGHNVSAVAGVLCETDSPKMPPERISLSYECLGETQLLLKIITGASKQTPISQWLAGENLPINQVKTANIEVVLLDNSAMPE